VMYFVCSGSYTCIGLEMLVWGGANCMQGSSHSGYMKCGEFIDWIGNC
jgi:hypothetical protein